MYGPVHASTAEKRSVRSVHDHVHLQGRDVRPDDLDSAVIPEAQSNLLFQMSRISFTRSFKAFAVSGFRHSRAP
jgi:hypothetical protein